MENIIIKFGEGVGVIFYFLGVVQDCQCFIWMLVKCGVDKNCGNVGVYGEQIINQLWYVVVIEVCQCFEDIQVGGFLKVIYFSGFIMLNGQLVVMGQML